MFKLIFRTLIFLLMLFVVLYTAMYNKQDIDFSFPILFSRSVREPAALIYFIVFAVGVVAGTMLNSGGGGGRRGGSKD